MTDTMRTTSTWTIDPSHSQVEFTVKHMMFSKVKGSFNEFSGTIELDEQNIENSRVDVRINPASIDTRDEKRDAHLRSADFFTVDEHDALTFVSTRVERARGDDLKVYGQLTMNGVTKDVVLDAQFNGRGQSPFGMEVLAYTATTKVNRREFNINWNAALETGGVLVGDEVTITLEIQAVPAQG